MYFGLFKKKSDLESEFVTDLSDYEILFAWYDYEDYDGEAYVLARKDGKLVEVYGSHCSCYGLEDKGWEEEAVEADFLKSGKGWPSTGYHPLPEGAKAFFAELVAKL